MLLYFSFPGKLWEQKECIAFFYAVCTSELGCVAFYRLNKQYAEASISQECKFLSAPVHIPEKKRAIFKDWATVFWVWEKAEGRYEDFERKARKELRQESKEPDIANGHVSPEKLNSSFNINLKKAWLAFFGFLLLLSEKLSTVFS